MLPKIVKLANRLAESILMNWDKEEQIKLAWETAAECNKIVTEFHKEGSVNMRETEYNKDLEECRNDNEGAPLRESDEC